MTPNQDVITTLKVRFVQNRTRHPDIDWANVDARLKIQPAKLRSLSEMEITGGEPDVFSQDPVTGEIVFMDFSPETPKARVSTCYDHAALELRKENKPTTSAFEMAARMGVEILTEAEYRDLQKLGEFDRKTSSWIHTPAEIRSLGGALFCERRWNRVFTFHNGASSYFSSRGFRASLRV
jgi:hypothetical protein